jgi:hypothetical protein
MIRKMAREFESILGRPVSQDRSGVEAFSQSKNKEPAPGSTKTALRELKF